jgi:hypothetical protein
VRVCVCVCVCMAGELIRDSRGCNYQAEKFCLLLALVAARQKLGRARTKAVSRRRLTAEVRVQFLAIPCGFCGGKSCNVRVFFLEYVGGHLSVSFHRCSNLILSSAPDVIYSCQLTVSVNNM